MDRYTYFLPSLSLMLSLRLFGANAFLTISIWLGFSLSVIIDREEGSSGGMTFVPIGTLLSKPSLIEG